MNFFHEQLQLILTSLEKKSREKDLGLASLHPALTAYYSKIGAFHSAIRYSEQSLIGEDETKALLVEFDKVLTSVWQSGKEKTIFSKDDLRLQLGLLKTPTLHKTELNFSDHNLKVLHSILLAMERKEREQRSGLVKLNTPLDKYIFKIKGYREFLRDPSNHSIIDYEKSEELITEFFNAIEKSALSGKPKEVLFSQCLSILNILRLDELSKLKVPERYIKERDSNGKFRMT